MFDLIIIGGGPAGMTAGIYAARKKIKTLILASDFFGQTAKTTEIDNWPGSPGIAGLALMESFSKHLVKFIDNDILTSIVGEKVINLTLCHPEASSNEPKDLVRDSSGKALRMTERRFQNDKIFCVKTGAGKEFEAKAVVIATGREPRELGVEGEKELVGKGVSYCATCDAPFFQNKQVAVIGGGNSALTTALELAKFAKKVLLFEQSQKLLADEILQEKVKQNKKITVRFFHQILKIEGNKKVESLVYQDKKTEKTFQVPLEGVFVAIGSRAISDFAKGALELNNDGEIKVDPKTLATSLPGVFACGDVNDMKYKQIIIASGQGAQATLSAHQYLQGIK